MKPSASATRKHLGGAFIGGKVKRGHADNRLTATRTIRLEVALRDIMLNSSKIMNDDVIQLERRMPKDGELVKCLVSGSRLGQVPSGFVLGFVKGEHFLPVFEKPAYKPNDSNYERLSDSAVRAFLKKGPLLVAEAFRDNYVGRVAIKTPQGIVSKISNANLINFPNSRK